MGLLGRWRQPPAAAHDHVPPTVLPLSYLGLPYRLTIRGESHWQPELRALRRRGDVWTAFLVREPDNKYDRNAVAVHIEGQCVCHIARQDAAEIAPQLDALRRDGALIACQVSLHGGDGDRRSIGVFIRD